MDSIFPNRVVADPSVAGPSNGIPSGSQNSLVLVPKSEPGNEFPPGFGFPIEMDSQVLTDIRRRKMPLSPEERSRMSELIRFKRGEIQSDEVQENLLVHADNQLSADVLESLLYNDIPSSVLGRASITNERCESYYLDLIRSTRMIYGSLLNYLSAYREVKTQRGLLRNPRFRGDLKFKASNYMRENGLWQHRDRRLVGWIPGVEVGDIFIYRIELCIVGLHGSMKGIIDFVPSSGQDPIATSLVISRDYEDDNSGNVVVFTVQGRRWNNGIHIGDQTLENGNLAMVRSMYHGIEIRVIRGMSCKESPTGTVYIYDGIYKIVESWSEINGAGCLIFKFKLTRMENQPVTGSSIFKFAESLQRNLLIPNRYIYADITHKQEKRPVHLFNDVDNDREPARYPYIPKTLLFPLMNIPITGCPCVSDSCSYDCPCSQMNGGEYAFDKNGILVRGREMVFECGVSCKCSINCRNRRTIKGLDKTFEVFRRVDKRWGVRSLDLILPGSFICELAGVAITMDQARSLTLMEMEGGVDSIIYSNQFEESWKELGGKLGSVKSKYGMKSSSGIEIEEFGLNLSSLRNFSFYIRHNSATANVFVQRVMNCDENLVYPKLIIFASQIIPPFREITLDYGTRTSKNNNNNNNNNPNPKKILKIET